MLIKMRADERLAKLPFIMITADSEISRVIEAKERSVDCVLIKPFNIQALDAKVKEAFRNH